MPDYSDFSKLLDQPAGRLLQPTGDDPRRAQLNAILTAVRALGGNDDLVYRQLAEYGGRRVRDSLLGSGVSASALEQELRILDKARDAKRQLAQHATKLLDAAPPTQVSDSGALTTPSAVVSRFAQARRLDARYQDADGRGRFEEDNLQAAEMGRDLLAELQGNQARASARQTTQRLDADIDRVVRDRDADRLRLLDQLRVQGLKTLDAELGEAKHLDTPPLTGQRQHGPLMPIQLDVGGDEPIRWDEIHAAFEQYRAQGDDARYWQLAQDVARYHKEV